MIGVVVRQIETTHTLSYFHSTTGRKQAELDYINYGYHYMHVIIIHVMLDSFSTYALPGNDALVGLS
jgi:hypothetical protein